MLNNSPHPQTVHFLAASIPILHTALLRAGRSACKQPKQGIRHCLLCNSLKYLLNYSLKSKEPAQFLGIFPSPSLPTLAPLGHKGTGDCRSAFWSLWSLGTSTLLFSREFARSKSFAQTEHQHPTKRGHFSTVAVSIQLWCWHSLMQPHCGCCNSLTILQKAQVSCTCTHLPPASSGHPAPSQASSSGRLEQGETWHCYPKKPHRMGTSHHRSQLEPAPFLNRIYLFNRFPLESLAFTTGPVLLAPRSLFQDFSTPWPSPWRF